MSWMENIGKVSTDGEAKDFTNTFVWTLPNLFMHSNNVMTPYVASPWFSLDDNQWRLVLVPNDVYQKSRHPSSSSLLSFKFVGLYLWKLNPTKSNNEYFVKFSLESGGCVTFNSYSLSHEMQTYKNEGTGVQKFLPLSIFSEYKKHISPSGYMKFVCSMKLKPATESLCSSVDEDQMSTFSDSDDDSYDEESLDSVEESDTVTETNISCKSKNGKESTEAEGVSLLVEHLKELFLNEENSDVKLKVGECEFPVHRAILSARSGVFASMFKHKMSENITGIVNIPDCPSDAFKTFLLFLYTADFDIITAVNVCYLYYVSDKYEVYDLKRRCVKFMMDTLSVDTFCNTLTLSLGHCETKLEKTATRFFCKNARDIIKTVQWQKYIQEYPIQANGLFIKALDYYL